MKILALLTALALTGCEHDLPRLVIRPTQNVEDVVAQSVGLDEDDIGEFLWSLERADLVVTLHDGQTLTFYDVEVRGQNFGRQMSDVKVTITSDHASPALALALVHTAVLIGVTLGYSPTYEVPDKVEEIEAWYEQLGHCHWSLVPPSPGLYDGFGVSAGWWQSREGDHTFVSLNFTGEARVPKCWSDPKCFGH